MVKRERSQLLKVIKYSTSCTEQSFSSPTQIHLLDEFRSMKSFQETLLPHICYSGVYALVLGHPCLGNGFSHGGIISDRQAVEVHRQGNGKTDKGLSFWNQPYPARRSPRIMLRCCPAIACPLRALVLQWGENPVRWDGKDLLTWPINSVDSEILKKSSYAVILKHFPENVGFPEFWPVLHKQIKAMFYSRSLHYFSGKC